MIKVPETIQKAAPLWSGRIKKEPVNELWTPKVKKGQPLDISHVCNCIVGEVHGFSNSYALMGPEEKEDDKRCITCDTYSYKFQSSIAADREEQLEDSLDTYGKHIERKYKDLL